MIARPAGIDRRDRAEGPVAGEIRETLRCRGTLMVNLIAGPGSGKTTLLAAAIEHLKPRRRVAVIAGDVATDLDAERLCRLGVPTRQILTGGRCHLDVREIRGEIDHLGSGEPLDLIFIENVGNLICPATHDLGEDFKVALLSVAEGDTRPLKCPTAFAFAAMSLVTKADLLPVVEFDVDSARRRIATLNPAASFIVSSAKSGLGVEEWCSLLEARVERKNRSWRPAPVS